MIGAGPHRSGGELLMEGQFVLKLHIDTHNTQGQNQCYYRKGSGRRNLKGSLCQPVDLHLYGSELRPAAEHQDNGKTGKTEHENKGRCGQDGRHQLRQGNSKKQAAAGGPQGLSGPLLRRRQLLPERGDQTQGNRKVIKTMGQNDGFQRVQHP